MAFVSIPGIQGKVFVPDKEVRSAKHACGDCFACQQCSDDRCRVCRRGSDDPALPDGCRSGMADCGPEDPQKPCS